MNRKSLTKGSLYLVIATFIFMVTGYMIHFALARLLGPASYGIYGVVISLVTLFNLILTSGIFQAVSRHISAGEDKQAVKWAAIKLQVAFSIVLFIIYELFSESFAILLGDITLTYFIRISGAIMIGYALYSVITGYFNGLEKFKTQAGLQIIYSFSKLFFMVGLILLGFSLGGALIGFALAPIIAFLAGLYLSRVGPVDNKTSKRKSKKEISWKQLIDFAWPVILYTVALNFFISIDLFSVNALIGESVQTGYYNAATTISRLPYSILCVIGVTLFPVISKLFSNGEKERANAYMKEAVRYLILLVAPATLLIFATSQSLISILYTSAYLGAIYPLEILSIGFAFLAIFAVLASCLMAIGRTKIPMLLALFLVAASLALNNYLIPLYGLNGAAYATTASCMLGTVLICRYSARFFGNFISFISVLRTLIASLVVFGVSLIISLPSIWLLPVEYLFLSIIYFLILIATRELNKSDFTRLYEALPKNIRAYLQNIKLIPR